MLMCCVGAGAGTQQPDPSQAFEMKTIGPQAISFDVSSAAKTFGLEVYQVALDDFDIREKQRQIALGRGLHGPLSDKQRAELEAEIKALKRESAELELKLQGDNPCDDKAADQWRRLVEFSRQSIQNENDQKLRVTDTDLGDYFQNAIDEFESWILVGEGALKRIDLECTRWKSVVPENPAGFADTGATAFKRPQGSSNKSQ